MAREKKTFTTADMIAAARMFYEENRSIKEIMGVLGVGRKDVNRMLKGAVEQRLVKFQFEEAIDVDLQHRLVRCYPSHLQEALIVPTQLPSAEPQGRRPDAALLKRLAAVAASYFDRLVGLHKGPLNVGLTGGESILEFANAVTDNKIRENVHVFPVALVGRGKFPTSAQHVDAVANVIMLWSRTGRLPDHCHYATVPPFDTRKRGTAGRKFVLNELKKIAEIGPVKTMVKQMDAIDVVFAGIGVVNLSGRMTATGLLDPIVTARDLRDEGAVADFCYNFLDDQGVGRDNWRLFLTAGHYSSHPGIEFFQEMVRQKKKVIAIAGPHKTEAILATLRAKAFNVLVTDSDTAIALIKHSGIGHAR